MPALSAADVYLRPMTLQDLADANAVRAAISEYDALGREAFLSKYKFGPARSYFLLNNGRAYDSKAIVGAAHGHQHGTPLNSADFSGGEATVATKLESLGFELLRPETQWHYRMGDVTTRAEIHGFYGGATYGGIEPSNRSPNVMIYTDPKQGALNGYNYDGWDANDPNVFYYTGEGRHGIRRSGRATRPSRTTRTSAARCASSRRSTNPHKRAESVSDTSGSST